MKRNFLKILSLLLISALLLVFSSCSDNSNKNTEAESSFMQTDSDDENITEQSDAEESEEEKPIYVSALVKESFFDEFSVCCKVCEYFYDLQGRVSVIKEYDGFENPVSVRTNEYNAENLICREIKKDRSGDITEITETEYDEKNRKTLVTVKNGKDEILHTVEHIYKEDGSSCALYKDRNGKITKKALFGTDCLVFTEEEYTSDGSIIKTDYIYSDDSVLANERKYYNGEFKYELLYNYENLKLQSVIFKDKDGELIKKRLYGYDIYGNNIIVTEENAISVPLFKRISEYRTEIKK